MAGEPMRPDFVLAYAVGDTAKGTEAKRCVQREAFERNLKAQGLTLQHETSPDNKTHFVKLYAPWEVLTRTAEIMRIKMPIKVEQAQSSKSVDPSLTAKLERLMQRMQNNKLMRQLSVKFQFQTVLDNDQATVYYNAPFARHLEDKFLIPEKKETFFSASQRGRIVWELLSSQAYDHVRVDRIGIRSMLRDGSYTAAFPLHDGEYKAIHDLRSLTPTKSPTNDRQLLYEHWARPIRWCRQQPINAIRRSLLPIVRTWKPQARFLRTYVSDLSQQVAVGTPPITPSAQLSYKLPAIGPPHHETDYWAQRYFGEKTGLYFAWLGFYTSALIPPALVGITCLIYGLATFKNNTPSEICDVKGMGNTTMCPWCSDSHNQKCQMWKLSESCMYSKVSDIFDNESTVAYSVAMALWATLFLEFWKRRQAVLQWKWDLLDFEIEEEQLRPQYHAHLSKRKRSRSAVTPTERAERPRSIHAWVFESTNQPNAVNAEKANAGSNLAETSFSNGTASLAQPDSSNDATKTTDISCQTQLDGLSLHEKSLRFCASAVSVLFFLCLVIVLVFSVILYRILVSPHMHEISQSRANVLIAVTASMLNLVCIMVVGRIYQSLAWYLTELEMPRTQTDFENSLTFKVFLFQFANFYASLFYVAFFKGKFAVVPRQEENWIFGKFRPEQCDPSGCFFELLIQLAMIMIGKQLLNNLMELAFPIVQNKYRAWRKKKHAAGAEGETQSSVNDYSLSSLPVMPLFEEYLEMVIQYGFVTLFVAAFPLAPLFALLNNVIEIRLDAYKFVTSYRRPVAERAKNIGIWYHILDGLSKLAVVTNACVIAFTTDFVPQLVYRFHNDPGEHTADNSLNGFVNYSLSQYRISDLPKHKPDRYDNDVFCYYSDYRRPPCNSSAITGHACDRDYTLGSRWFVIFGARLAFVVIFEHAVLLIKAFVAFIIPDVPESLKQQVQREHLLAKQAKMENELARVTKPSTIVAAPPDSTGDEFVAVSLDNGND